MSSKWENIKNDSAEDEAQANNLAEDGQEEAPAEIGYETRTELTDELNETEAKLNALNNDKIRLAAELQNAQKRHERELSNRAKFAVEDFARSLLPVMDSCVEGLKLEVDAGNDDAKAMQEGLELIAKQMLSVFNRFHIQEVNPQGDVFDPEKHEAMLAQPSESVQKGLVIEVIQKGYQIHDRTLRPARVIVSKGQDA